MNAKEFESWTQSMKHNRGHWKVDPVHDGSKDSGKSLLLYKTKDDDHTSGEYISVVENQVHAGQFEGAVPHMGEALFKSLWSQEFKSYNEALTTVVERVGVSLLFALILPGGSPYRN